MTDTKYLAAALKLKAIGYVWRCDEWTLPETDLALKGDACVEALRQLMNAGLGNSTDFAEQSMAYFAGVAALARLRG